MRKKYGEITKDVLLTLATGAIIAVAATSPYFLINLARIIAKSKKYNKSHKNFKEKSFARSLIGLEKNKIIIVTEKERKFTVNLTEKGRRVVKEIQFDDMKIKKQKIWDKRWRVVIFDIPERSGRIARNAMRWKMKNMGFFQLQKSVWVFPYPCEKEIQLISEIYNVNPFVNIITAERIFNDDNLSKYFKIN
ncbi:MAG: hypothetical protein AAB509_02760 [Patescibacteria group bacterium]